MYQGASNEKKICDNKISFYDGDKELISLKFVGSNFTIYIYTDVKTCSLLVWHSDCYYNPDDIISVSSLSTLHIKFEDGI